MECTRKLYRKTVSLACICGDEHDMIVTYYYEGGDNSPPIIVGVNDPDTGVLYEWAGLEEDIMQAIADKG